MPAGRPSPSLASIALPSGPLASLDPCTLVKPGQAQQIDAGGRKWSLFANFTDSDGVNCAAGLAVSATSSIQIVSGDLDDPNGACDAVKAGIPMVAGNLPG
ncbi:hypothetical protein ATK36_3158 [Amycolatopsis sulphurea]|uniref:Uncharacterized protein n=1 Tax=Amycolatopsis sulphurea TaxID=76022 RepID=A0A2A9F9P9_9PSEU|nr:hypothetical protein [Amycolatopsis sulphurea]PFG48084.1 hypothetical protein ATK36_3158 [Amycolatopsis sulphurea]